MVTGHGFDATVLAQGQFLGEQGIDHLERAGFATLELTHRLIKNLQRPGHLQTDQGPCECSRVAGNGIFGCRDRAPKTATQRDERAQRQKSRNRVAEIPAETAYLASSPNNAVCKGWVVVCAVICEPVSAAIPRWKPRQSAVFRFL